MIVPGDCVNSSSHSCVSSRSSCWFAFAPAVVARRIEEGVGKEWTVKVQRTSEADLPKAGAKN